MRIICKLQKEIFVKEYTTEQRKKLFSFLEQNSDCQFTMEEIRMHLKEISESAVYRNINKLLDEGLIQRFQKDGSRKFVYQYVGDVECSQHIHLQCNSCGTIIHADKQLTNFILESVANDAKFQVDILKTIFIGKCQNCF